MKNLTFLICCINIHLLGASVAADDILAMLQSSLRVNAQGQGVEQGQAGEQTKNQDSGAPDMASVARLEEIVMARVREGSGGDDKLVATINASVKQMFTAIIATTAANQNKIILDIKAFLLCKTKMWKNYDPVIPIEKEFWILGEIYPKCTAAESKLKVLSMKSDELHKMHSSNVKTKKKLAQVVEQQCKDVCNNEKYESYQEQLEKLTKYYVDCAKKIKPKVDEVVKSQIKYKKVAGAKRFDNARYRAMKSKCDLIAYRMNGKKCKAVQKMKATCSFYEECWKRTKKVYETDKTRIMTEEANMKVQWRALTRIQCYLLVLNTQKDKDKKKEEAQLNKCINMKKEQISTKHLDIDYKQIPQKPVCPKDPWCPCTKAYTNQYYKTGPKTRCAKNIVKKYICTACPKGMPKKLTPKTKPKKKTKQIGKKR